MVKSSEHGGGQLPNASSTCRKLLHKPTNSIKQRQRPERRCSFVRTLVDYLTSDSFMYGPLLTPPPSKPTTLPKQSGPLKEGLPRTTPPASPNTDSIRREIAASLHSPATARRSGIRSMSTSTKGVIHRSAANEHNKIGSENAPAEPELPRRLTDVELYFASPPFKNNKVVVQDVGEGDGDCCDRYGGLTDQADVEEGDDDESCRRSFTESQNSDGWTPLHKEAAKEVARRLVKKVGGRYSKGLGIYVDIGDSEVERWFLATTFLSHPSDFEMAKHTFKKLQTMGISKIQDVLGVDQSELEEAFQSTIHNQRMASRLQKIANALHTDHGGGICALKCISDYTELKQELENLPGYSRSAARLFLREMRGVWPGAIPEIEACARNAAKHLHLVSSFKDDAGLTSSLVNLGQDAGLDERDFEVALVKLGLQHARQYRSCPSGGECEFLRTTLSDLDRLIVAL